MVNETGYQLTGYTSSNASSNSFVNGLLVLKEKMGIFATWFLAKLIIIPSAIVSYIQWITSTSGGYLENVSPGSSGLVNNITFIPEGSNQFFGTVADVTTRHVGPFFGLLAIVATIGLINWAIWIIRRTRAIFYKVYKTDFTSDTSVVIPVYKEKPEILRETVNSILENNPSEVILVVDHTEKENLEMLHKEYGNRKEVVVQITNKIGKRPSLVEGIKKSKSEIVVLVDSDTQWKSHNFLANLIMPFAYEDIGGVGSRQKVRLKKSWGQHMVDWLLDIKYSDYIPSDSLSGSVLCLSGRTAAYRRKAIINVLNDLENEKFLWHKCMGGDDARLTSLVLKQGYKTVYQDNCVAESYFHPSFGVYLKQKIRWARNSFRTYIKNVFSLWPWQQGKSYYLMAAYHTTIPGLTFLLGFGLFLYSLYIGFYSFAILYVLWALVARAIKSYSHLKKEPKDIILLPAVVIFYLLLSFLKLYAFITMTHESWSGSRGEYKIKKGKRV